jgi:hypothetical protein
MQLEAYDLAFRTYSDRFSGANVDRGIQIQVPGNLPVPIADIIGVGGVRAADSQ